MERFWLCFVPLFVAVDAFGILPIFVGLTEGLERRRLRWVIVQSVLTAWAVAMAFLVFGGPLLEVLGVGVADFMVAGGLLLLAISLTDLLSGRKMQREPDAESLGAVPIGVPLISGPAVLTACILLAGVHGRLMTAVAATLNIALAGVVFWFSAPLTRLLGRTGTRAVSKVASLLLAAFAVMLVRRGVMAVLEGAASP